MNNINTYIQIYPLLFSCIFMISSQGQDNTKVQQDSTVELNTEINNTSMKGNQAKNQNIEIPWVDPLFYIDGQLCQHVRKIYQDKSGDLWFGTNVYGLMRYDGDKLEYISEIEELGLGRITGILEDKEGNVWFGAYGGISKYDGESFTNFSEKDGLVDKEVWSLTIDSKGTFWVGTMEGVNRFDGKVFAPFDLPRANIENPEFVLSPSRIICITEDRNGTLWIGTDGLGIYKYNGESFSHTTKKDGLPDNIVREIMEDSKGNIWICTMFGGISRYDGKSFSNFTEDGVVSGIEVGGLFEDKAGNIWFAAENNGVYCYDGKTFTNFNTKDGLNTNGILSIFEDKEGRFWFGGWGGLFRYDGKSFFSVTKLGPWH